MKLPLVKASFAILLLTALVAVVLAFTSVPWWLTKIDLDRINSGVPIPPDKQLEAVEAVRDRFLKIAAGIGALGTLLFTGLSWVEARKLNLVTRYSSATEKLGAGTPADRVGGIYALEQLARDYPPYHAPVVDVLAAFIRARSREGDAASAGPVTSAIHSPGKVRPISDVQAALTVLGRRNQKLARKEYDALRFSDCILTGANLRRANLRGVRFRRAYLEDVRFEGAHLESAKFRDAVLKGAHLEGANVDGADFDGASLDDAHLAGAKGNPKLDKVTGKLHCRQHEPCSRA